MSADNTNQTINANYDPAVGWQFAFDDFSITVTYCGAGIPALGWTVWTDGSQWSSHGDDLGEAMMEALDIQRTHMIAKIEVTA